MMSRCSNGIRAATHEAMSLRLPGLLLTSAFAIGCVGEPDPTVSGQWRLIGGQSSCTDEDGDPESIQIAVFEAGSTVELHRYYFDCSEAGFEIPFAPGTYDIRVEAWQTVFLVDDLENSHLFDDVVVDGSGSVDLGLVTLDINDDDQ